MRQNLVKNKVYNMAYEQKKTVLEGDIVIMDNLTSHKVKGVIAAVLRKDFSISSPRLSSLR